MILSDKEIKQLIKKGKLKFKPKLKPGQIGQASVDLTLGDIFWVFKESNFKGVVDLKKKPFQKAITKIKQKSITLDSQEMCLGITKERITLPADILGRLEGRSRYARMGLAVHITSALVQPGSDNHQVLEIVNMAPFPIRVHAGMKISQIVFHRLESKTTKPYNKHGKIAKRQ